MIDYYYYYVCYYVSWCLLSNSKISLFLIIKNAIILYDKINHFNLLSKHFSLSYIFLLHQITF